MVDQESLVKKIKMLSDSIRKKTRALKMGISQRDEFLENTFKPVIAPLKEISQKLNENPITESDMLMPVKKTIGYKDNSSETDSDKEVQSLTEDGETSEHEQDKTIDSSLLRGTQTVGDPNLTLLNTKMVDFGELGKKYVLKMLHGTISNRKHHVYGARLEKNGLMIGDSELQVDDSDNLKIKGKTYPGSHGLFELVFKKVPAKYNATELKLFKQICLATNLHKKKYASESPIHRGSSMKYKNIILKLFPSKKSGSGMMFKNVNKPNIIYYNDVNKLVDRMRLLHEAQQVGHTGVENELISLTDELRQRGYII